MSRPIFTVIAGANGSGKSTMTKWAKAFFQHAAVLDPDAIAVELRAQSDAQVSDIEAGKEVLRAAESFLNRQVSFSIETTLSGGTYLRMFERARGLGFATRLFYIGTESVDINLERVAARAREGGHNVPEEDQRRRYPRSLRNMRLAVTLCDECVLFDNSTDAGHRVVGLKLAQMNLLPVEPVPGWAEFLREDLPEDQISSRG